MNREWGELAVRRGKGREGRAVEGSQGRVGDWGQWGRGSCDGAEQIECLYFYFIKPCSWSLPSNVLANTNSTLELHRAVYKTSSLEMTGLPMGKVRRRFLGGGGGGVSAPGLLPLASGENMGSGSLQAHLGWSLHSHRCTGGEVWLRERVSRDQSSLVWVMSSQGWMALDGDEEGRRQSLGVKRRRDKVNFPILSVSRQSLPGRHLGS